MKNNIFFKSGFSLLELLVVIAMIGGLSAVVMNLTKQSNKSSTKYQYDLEIAQISNEIVSVLSNPTNCIRTFPTYNIVTPPANTTIKFMVKFNPTTSIESKQYYISSEASAPSEGYGNSKMKVRSYYLSASVAELAAKNAFLTIEFENKKILAGTETIKKKLKLNIEVNASDIITSCNAVASGAASQWVTSGADIFYPSGGNVGVAIANPNSTFQTNGSFSTKVSQPPFFNVGGSISDTDSIVLINATTANITATLPTAVGISGRQYTIKRIDATAFIVKVQGTGGETIDGQPDVSLFSQYKFITVVSDGANWLIIGGGRSVSTEEGVLWY